MKHLSAWRARLSMRAGIAALGVCLTACAAAPAGAPLPTETTTTQGSASMADLPNPYLAFTKFVVKDLDKMEAFYTDVFGFERANVIANDAFEERIMRLPGGTTSLVLYHYKDGREITVGNGHGPIGLMTSDVDALHLKALAAGGSEKLAPVEFGTARLSFVLDPEGHELEIINMNGASRE